MTLDQINAAERMGHRAIRAVHPFVENAVARDALERVEFILAEVRHFAQCWADIRDEEDSKGVDAETARRAHQAAIARLLTSVAPARV